MNNGVYALPGFMPPAATNKREDCIRANEDGSIKLCVYCGLPESKVYYSLGVPGWDFGFIQDVQYYIDNNYPEEIINRVRDCGVTLEEVSELPSDVIVPVVDINGWPIPITEIPLKNKAYWVLDIPKFIIPPGDTKVQISAAGRVVKYTIHRPTFTIHSALQPGCQSGSGAGNTALADMVAKHASDTSLHITDEERAAWDGRLTSLEQNVRQELLTNAPNEEVVENVGAFMIPPVAGEFSEIRIYGAPGNEGKGEVALWVVGCNVWSDNVVEACEGEMVFKFEQPLELTATSNPIFCIQPRDTQPGHINQLTPLRLYATHDGAEHMIMVLAEDKYMVDERIGKLAMTFTKTAPIYATADFATSVEDHIEDSSIHVTTEEKARWNSVDTKLQKDSSNAVSSGAVHAEVYSKEVLVDIRKVLGVEGSNGKLIKEAAFTEWTVPFSAISGCTRVEIISAVLHQPACYRGDVWLIAGNDGKASQISINSDRSYPEDDSYYQSMVFDFAQPLTMNQGRIQFWLTPSNRLLDLQDVTSLWSDKAAIYLGVNRKYDEKLIPASRYYGADTVALNTRVTALENSLESVLESDDNNTDLPLIYGSDIAVASDKCGVKAIALGNNNKATGQSSTAIGDTNNTTGAITAALGYNNIATGNFSTALGYNNKAEGQYSTSLGSSNESTVNRATALGYKNKADGQSSTALGDGNKASNYAAALGYSNEATGNNSTALGCYNKATGNSSTVLGCSNEATGDYTTALGYNNEVSSVHAAVLGNNNTLIGDRSIVIGYESTVDGANSIALGYESYSSGTNSVAIGCTAVSNANNATVLGYNSKASGSNATALGFNNKARGVYSTASGYNNEAAGSYSTALGYSNEATGNSSTALGYSSKATAGCTAALGYSSKATAYGSTALGYNNEATGDYTTALGYNNDATVSCATALGHSNQATAQYTIALGYCSKATGPASTALGVENKAKGIYATALGISNEATGDCSAALGYYNSASGTNSTAVGHYNDATGYNSIAIGMYTTANANSSTALGISARTDKEGSLVISATNQDSGTSVSLELVAGTATGGEGDMFSDDKFVADTDVKLTVRDMLTGREHRVSVSLSKLMQHLVQDLQGVSEFSTNNGGDDGYYYY